jgi:hypothetical protein
MKQIKFLFLMTSIFTCLVFTQPKLSIEKTEIELGTVYTGTPKIGRIVYKNIGNDTLIISVSSTCGCTKIKEPKQFLLPKETDYVEFEFTSLTLGKIEKHINIFSNDPTAQSINVKFYADVKEELQLVGSSNMLWLNNIAINNTSEKDITLKNVSNHPINIKEFKASSPSITIKAKENKLNPNETLSIQITVKAEAIGYKNEFVAIETDSKNQPTFEIRISYIGMKGN